MSNDEIGMGILLVVGITCIAISIFMMRLEAKTRRAGYHSGFDRRTGTGNRMEPQIPTITKKEANA